MSETELVSSILARLTLEPGVIAWRNNTGVARVHGSTVRYGLGNGSPDIVVVAGPDGRFVGLEVKVERGVQSVDQQTWEKDVSAVGGGYAVVRSVEEAVLAVRKARRGR